VLQINIDFNTSIALAKNNKYEGTTYIIQLEGNINATARLNENVPPLQETVKQVLKFIDS